MFFAQVVADLIKFILSCKLASGAANLVELVNYMLDSCKWYSCII